MIYQVTAMLKKGVAAEFHRKLQDGTIAGQKPDGQEIVDSMNRAVITETGQVAWSQTCFCATPLAHERQTVYDQYFDELCTDVIAGHRQFAGEAFMDHLAELAAGS